MKKLFFCVMALAIGASAFVSCDKSEKDDLTENNKKSQVERVDTSTVLTLSQQQNAFNKAVGKFGQDMEFTDIAQAVGMILNQFKYKVEWDNALKAACKQDLLLAMKVNAIKHYLKFSGDFSVNFNELFFEADIAFKDSVIRDSTEYFYYRYTYNIEESQIDEKVSAYLDSLIIEDTIMVPFLAHIDHDADKLKLNLHTTDGSIISFCLVGHSDSESRLALTDKKNSVTRNITLPDTLNISLTLNDHTLLCVNTGYATNFKVEVKGADDEKGKFKLSDLRFTGNELSLDADALLGMYAVNANVNYNDENGLNAVFAANVSGTEVISGNVHLNGVFNSSLNWAEPTNIMVWASNSESFKGIDCNVNIFSDEIKMHVGIDNPLLNGSVLQFMAYLFSKEPLEPADADLERMISEFNNTFKGEIYFKGYDKPQAVVKLVHDPSITKAVNRLFDVKTMVGNFERLGLKIGIETYNDDGVKVFVPFKEYFVEEDYKAFVGQLKQKLEIAFGQLISAMYPKLSVGKIRYLDVK